MTSGASPPRQPDPDHLVEVALRYAAHGWPVLPLHAPLPHGCSCGSLDCGSPGKHPRTRRGLHDATTDPTTIRGWWGRWPHANLGVATGDASGLLVLDIDLPDGPVSLERLQAEHGALPPTCEQRTGSGGRQLLFRRPAGDLGNRAGLMPGIDVRGDGGYIVVPPSVHASGGRYRWVVRAAAADPPSWLLALLRDRDRTRPVEAPAVPSARPLPVGEREQRYAAVALTRELGRLAAAPVGTRNDTLNRAAFNLGQLTGAGLLDPDHVAAELEHIAIDIGLGVAETRRTIASGLAAGHQHPRTPPAPAPPGRPGDVPVRRIAARRR